MIKQASGRPRGWSLGVRGHWQKGEAVGSKPLKTSFSEPLSCSVAACSDCAGLFPPKGLLVPPGFVAGFTTPKREDTGRLWTPEGAWSAVAPGAP